MTSLERPFRRGGRAAAGLLLALSVGVGWEPVMKASKAETVPDVRFVVVHKPGPRWRPGVDFREQPGVAEHVQHYRELHAQGKLELGGPYLLPDSGGMMIPAGGLSREEVRAFAASDPAVASGLLEFEIRPWYVAMKRD